MSDRKNPTEKGCVNGDLCSLFIELAEHERNVERNIHKYNAYRKAVATLAAYPERIRSGHEARRLRGVGVKIANKIQEFLETGRLRKLEAVRGDERAQTVKDLTRVSGVGPTRAAELVRAGITSVEQLRQHLHLLNHHQRIGLRYLEDFEVKIPRTEIQEIEKFLREVICGWDSGYMVMICGSYRRGKSESGDVDALVTHPLLRVQEAGAPLPLRAIVRILQDKGLVTDVISVGDTKFMGVCCVKAGRARRLDIRLVRREHWPCAQLYFTGSDAFNYALRAHALQRHFTLNEYTLRPIGETGVAGEPAPVCCEQDIFDYIEFPYCEPCHRNA